MLKLLSFLSIIGCAYAQQVDWYNNIKNRPFIVANLVCDGSTDNSPIITKAINNLPSSGGTIFIPNSNNTCMMQSTITITRPHITIEGQGADFYFKSGMTNTKAGTTILKWNGTVGGTMFIITSGVSNTDEPISLVMFKNLEMDCGGTAAIGTQFISTLDSGLNTVVIRECTSVDADFEVASNSNPNNANRPIIYNYLFVNNDTSGGKTGYGLKFGGNLTANTNYARAYNIKGWYNNSPGIYIPGGDSNSFFGVYLTWMGSGSPAAGVLLDGTSSVTLYNNFHDLDPGTKGVLQQNGASQTQIYGYNNVNSAPDPVSTTGSGNGITYTSDRGWQVGATQITLNATYTSAAQTHNLENLSTTLSASESLDAIVDSSASTDVTFTTQSASALCNTFNRPQGGNGSNFSMAGVHGLTIRSNTSHTITLAAGSGVSINGSATTTVGQSHLYAVEIRSCVSGSEAIAYVSKMIGTW